MVSKRRDAEPKKKRGKKRGGQSWRAKRRDAAGEREAKLLGENRVYRAVRSMAARGHERAATSNGGEAVARVKGRHSVAIALPGSILDNAQSAELRTYLAGQIGRAAAVFCADEIVVYDEAANLTQSAIDNFLRTGNVWGESGRRVDCNLLLARILQYLETPQYLRKRLFPLQRELQYAGLLNPLDCPHHLRADDMSVPYREAVVLDKPVKGDSGSFADAGLTKEVQLNRQLAPGTRVTVDFARCDFSRRRLLAKVVSPRAPLAKLGLYWGYTVRLAGGLGAALYHEAAPPGDKGGGGRRRRYDLAIGTSERGDSAHRIGQFAPYRSCVIVLGGLAGIESALEADQSLGGTTTAADLFEHYVNVLPGQGSRTVRTEEALPIALAVLRRRLRRAGARAE